MSATAGWYADPTDDAAVRWWDGERWTDTTRPAPRELVGASARVEAHAPAQVAEAPRPAAAPRHVMAARPAVIEPEVLPDADRSRPGSGPAPVVLRPEPTTPVDFMSAMGSVGASGDAARQPATSQFGAPLGIGHAPSPSAPSRAEGLALSSAPLTRPRHWVRTVVVLVLVLALAAAAAILVVPRVLDQRAAAAAAAAPALVPAQAPASFAGVRRAALPVTPLNALAPRLSTNGAAWDWTQGYRNGTAGTLVLGAELGATDRAAAYRALTDHARGQDFIAALVADVATGSGTRDVAGDPSQYASPVGGSLWCLPYASSGIAGGLCAWTNGRQILVTETLPGVQESAARSLLGELAALGTAASKTASAAPRS